MKINNPINSSLAGCASTLGYVGASLGAIVVTLLITSYFVHTSNPLLLALKANTVVMLFSGPITCIVGILISVKGATYVIDNIQTGRTELNQQQEMESVLEER